MEAGKTICPHCWHGPAGEDHSASVERLVELALELADGDLPSGEAAARLQVAAGHDPAMLAAAERLRRRRQPQPDWRHQEAGLGSAGSSRQRTVTLGGSSPRALTSWPDQPGLRRTPGRTGPHLRGPPPEGLNGPAPPPA